MNLKLRKAEPGDLTACIPVFEDSAIYERYFKGDGRLERSLATAVERGELHLAVTDSGEIAGAMRVMPRGFCGLYPYLSLAGGPGTGIRRGPGHADGLRFQSGCPALLPTAGLLAAGDDSGRR